MSASKATRTGVQLPSPPVFARNEVESEDCRAVALAKAGLCHLQHACCELRLGKPALEDFGNCRANVAKPYSEYDATAKASRTKKTSDYQT